MPRREADALALQYRLAFEAVKHHRGGRREAVALAHVVLFTLFLTEAGHGLLDLSTIREAETGLARVLNDGESTGQWQFPEALIQLLKPIVNEHDRQLREVRLSEIASATKRLDHRRKVALQADTLSKRKRR
jgi:hypothetical protein